MNVITGDKNTCHTYGYIDKEFLKNNIADFNQKFYVCGPEAFNDAIMNALKELGADASMLVFEK